MKNEIPEKLIIANGKDVTSKVKSIKAGPGANKKTIVFNGGNNKPYVYNSSNVRILQQKRRYSLANDQTIVVDGVARFDFKEVQTFDGFTRLIKDDGKYDLYENYRVKELKKENGLASPKDLLCYYRELASEVGLVSNGKNLLEYNYSKLKEIPTNSVLFDYINNNTDDVKGSDSSEVIFPFGFNLSQKKAVENALGHKVSIIEGPPGTGKTQTILNIIANVLMNNETVAVVSNNNTAIRNVYEKLEKNGVEFIAAVLGSHENREIFVEQQRTDIDVVKQWGDYSSNQRNNLLTLKLDERLLNQKLEAKNKLAEILQQKDAIDKEYHYYKESIPNGQLDTSFKPGLSANDIMILLSEIEYLNENGLTPGLIKRIIWRIKYGIKYFSLNEEHDSFADYCERAFYTKRIGELHSAENRLLSELDAYDFNNKMKQYTSLSMDVFKGILAKKYPDGSHKKEYTIQEIKKDSHAFASDYPVILSTTFSLRSSLNNSFLYDYVIIDEASQVDLLTGVLALSCAKKAVIVGDLKQLPNVIDSDTRKTASQISRKHGVDERYDYTEHSILSSIKSVFENAPEVLLREHYRCTPEIINFCNKRFYDDSLIVLSERHKNIQPMMIYRTAAGNHARDKVNRRQIEVIRDEVIPALKLEKNDSVGIVTPYRNQANALQKEFEGTEIQADTVDKYQGQERTVMIFSTVDNEIGDFASDPNRLNVAVSRATDQFIVVTNGNDNDKDSAIKDLLGYIKYNNYEIVDSEINSVFDNLYKCHEQAREEIIRKYGTVSQYDSENLMYSLIKDELERGDYHQYDVSTHVPLRHLIKDMSKMNQREIAFATNPNSHIDFVVFSRLDHRPVLAIEVDGFKYHDMNEKQLERDSVKDDILRKYDIPLERFSTTGSQESMRLKEALARVS